jgi:hypothetical protein
MRKKPIRETWPDLDAEFRYKAQKRPYTTSQYKRPKVASMDTETQDGFVQTIHSAKLGKTDNLDKGFTTHLRDKNEKFQIYDWLIHAIKYHSWVNRSQPKGKRPRLYLKTPDFFAWNLGFDSGVMMKTLPPETLEAFALNSTQVINLHTGELAQGIKRDKNIWVCEDGKKVEKNKFAFILYINKKVLKIEPINMWIQDHKVSTISLYDISQLFKIRRLQDAAMKYLNEGKDDLDTEMMGRGGPESDKYWKDRHDDIIQYGERDAILTARLAWIRLNEYQEAGVVVHRPLSKASIARNNLFRICDKLAEEFEDPMLCYPILDGWMKHNVKRPIIEAFLSAYAGGWFEMSLSGLVEDVVGYDLVSAYPAIMHELPNFEQLMWITDRTTKIEDLEKYLGRHRMYWPAIIYARVEFPKGLPFYPLACMNEDFGTVQNPRIVKRWMTADELIESRKWGGKTRVYHWAYSTVSNGHRVTIPQEEDRTRAGVDSSGVHYPFRPFLSTFYSIKAGVDLIPKEDRTAGDNARREVSKVMLNSGYGLTLCTVGEGEEDEMGNVVKWERTASMWCPMYAAIITAGCRMRIAEFMRVNNHKVISVATDGVVIKKSDLLEVPLNLTPIASSTLGDWESEAVGDFFAIGSGVYSIVGPEGKTTVRGHASRFINLRDKSANWLDWCRSHANDESVEKDYYGPYSMGEARVRSNYDLVGQFRKQTATMRPSMDAMKRPIWPDGKPTTFGDLVERRFRSLPPTRITEKVRDD